MTNHNRSLDRYQLNGECMREPAWMKIVRLLEERGPLGIEAIATLLDQDPSVVSTLLRNAPSKRFMSIKPGVYDVRPSGFAKRRRSARAGAKPVRKKDPVGPIMKLLRTWGGKCMTAEEMAERLGIEPAEVQRTFTQLGWKPYQKLL
jgi:hypothetical protein